MNRLRAVIKEECYRVYSVEVVGRSSRERVKGDESETERPIVMWYSIRVCAHNGTLCATQM